MKNKPILIIKGDLIVDKLVAINKKHSKLIISENIDEFIINKSTIINDNVICNVFKYGDTLVVMGKVIVAGKDMTYAEN